MKVLLVNGSPNEKGCTFTALTEVAKTLNEEGIETEIFWIGKNVNGCMSCFCCRGKGKCIKNDIVNAFIDKAAEADGFVFGSPVHYAGACGNMTSFMDRAFFAASQAGNNVFVHKPASVISSARRAGTTATYEQLIKYMGISQMPIISSRYWNMVHGSNPDEVKRDLEGMQTMRILGKNMAYFLKCLKAGKDAGIELPQMEDVVFTNFIR